MMKKKISSENILTIILLVIVAWIVFSWMEVITKNTNISATYYPFNFFVILITINNFIRN